MQTKETKTETKYVAIKCQARKSYVNDLLVC